MTKESQTQIEIEISEIDNTDFETIREILNSCGVTDYKKFEETIILKNIPKDSVEKIKNCVRDSLRELYPDCQIDIKEIDIEEEKEKLSKAIKIQEKYIERFKKSIPLDKHLKEEFQSTLEEEYKKLRTLYSLNKIKNYDGKPLENFLNLYPNSILNIILDKGDV